MDHCLRSRHYVNVVIAGKHPAPQWLTMDAAVQHCTQGIGIWQWASNDQGVAPDVVMACCGDVPTLETLAAVSILRARLPELKIRVVNVVDLMRAATSVRTSSWTQRHRFRRTVHAGQASHLRLSCLPVVDPSADVSPDESQQHPRPRLQGRRDHYHTLRHDGAERSGPLPSGDGHHRSPASDWRQGDLFEAAAQGQVDRAQAIHRQIRSGSAGNSQLEVDSVKASMEHDPVTSNCGTVVSVRGSVVDIRFDAHLPPIYTLLHAKAGTIAIEVLAQLDSHRVRGIALTPTQGLARGMTVQDTSGPLKAPVGKGLLSRMFDVFGNSIDRQPAPSDVQWRSVHRAASAIETAFHQVGNLRNRYQGDRCADTSGTRWQGGTLWRRRRGQDRAADRNDPQHDRPSGWREHFLRNRRAVP